MDIASERADWLLDAIGCATQNPMFLRGEPEEDKIVTEAILANGKKAIETATAALRAENERLHEENKQWLESYSDLKAVRGTDIAAAVLAARKACEKIARNHKITGIPIDSPELINVVLTTHDLTKNEIADAIAALGKTEKEA